MHKAEVKLKTFEEAKEETYSLFEKRCGELLRDFQSQKDKAVCLLCSESCTKIEKTHKALRDLISWMVLDAIEECENNADIWVCALCPYLATLDFFKSYGKGKTSELLTSEMEKGRDRLLTIIRRGKDERQGKRLPSDTA